MAREVDIILDEHSEVFGTVYECRPEREREAKWGSVTTGAEGGSGPVGPKASGLLLGSMR